MLSISRWWLIRLGNAFVFPDPESPIINILYRRSEIYSQFGLCFLMFSLVISSKLIIYVLFYYIFTCNFFFFYILGLLSFYMYVFLLNRLIVFLSSLAPNAILLTSSILCSSSRNLCCYFNINLLSLWIFYDFL